MPIFVTQVTPNTILTGQSLEVMMHGAGFKAPVTVIINGTNLPAFFVTDRVVKFVLPYIVAGTYDITVVNSDGSKWICRNGFKIVDPPVSAAFDNLGSAARPIILAPRTIEVAQTATVNSAVKARRYSSATTQYDAGTGVITGKLKPDMSYLPTEPIKADEKQPLPSEGKVLDTPWGTFKNE